MSAMILEAILDQTGMRMWYVTSSQLKEHRNDSFILRLIFTSDRVGVVIKYRTLRVSKTSVLIPLMTLSFMIKLKVE